MSIVNYNHRAFKRLTSGGCFGNLDFPKLSNWKKVSSDGFAWSKNQDKCYFYAKLSIAFKKAQSCRYS